MSFGLFVVILLATLRSTEAGGCSRGHLLGDKALLAKLKRLLNPVLKPGKAGRKLKKPK